MVSTPRVTLSPVRWIKHHNRSAPGRHMRNTGIVDSTPRRRISRTLHHNIMQQRYAGLYTYAGTSLVLALREALSAATYTRILPAEVRSATRALGHTHPITTGHEPQPGPGAVRIMHLSSQCGPINLEQHMDLHIEGTTGHANQLTSPQRRTRMRGTGDSGFRNPGTEAICGPRSAPALETTTWYTYTPSTPSGTSGSTAHAEARGPCSDYSILQRASGGRSVPTEHTHVAWKPR